MGIDVFNLVKSEEQLALEAQEQQQQAMMQTAMQNSDKMANAAHCTRDADGCGNTPESASNDNDPLASN